jgi:hypothetical protein
MRIQVYTGLILTFLSVTSAQNCGPLSDPHKHVVAVHEKPWKTDLAPEVKMIQLEGTPVDIRDSVISPNGRWLAFVFSVQDEWARVGFQEIRSGKRYQLINLPLAYRPINDIVWIDSTLVTFDRWSQPHYGMHYVVDVQNTRLVLAAPFPDEFFLRQQRDTIH